MSVNEITETRQYLTFKLGNEIFATDVATVREVLDLTTITAIPRTPDFMRGVINLRGSVVPVVDLRLRFGLPSVPSTRRTKWIVVDVSGRLVALVVDGVSEVFGTAGAELRPAPPLGGGEDLRGISGVSNRGSTLIFVLDTSRLRDLTEKLVASGRLGPSQPPVGPPGLGQGRST